MHFLSYSSKCIKKRWRTERRVRQIFYTFSFAFFVFLRLLEIARRRETICTYIIDDTVIFMPSRIWTDCVLGLEIMVTLPVYLRVIAKRISNKLLLEYRLDILDRHSYTSQNSFRTVKFFVLSQVHLSIEKFSIVQSHQKNLSLCPFLST